MGRNSKFNEVRPRDLWPTVDPDAVTNLLPFISGRSYAEVCAGSGDLIDLIGHEADCRVFTDMEPMAEWVLKKNALDYTKDQLTDCDFIITNPPFSWVMLKPLLDHLPTLKPTWLLLPAGSMHNIRMYPYMSICKKAVAVGRLYWVEEPDIKPIKGKDDFVWLLLDANYKGPTEFVARRGVSTGDRKVSKAKDRKVT